MKITTLSVAFCLVCNIVGSLAKASILDDGPKQPLKPGDPIQPPYEYPDILEFEKCVAAAKGAYESCRESEAEALRRHRRGLGLIYKCEENYRSNLLACALNFWNAPSNAGK